MFAHDARQARMTALDLSRWIGPLSPAFAAIAAANESSEGGVGEAGPRGQAGSSGERPQDVRLTSPEPGRGKPEAATATPEAPTNAQGAGDSLDLAEVRTLFHTLNNQLGVILTYAELLEAKAGDEAQRKRATQVVTATLEALGTTKALRTEIVKG
jgi:hypothetical protein